MKKSTLLVILYSCVLSVFAQTSPVLPLLETQQPVQQFVMAEESAQPAVPASATEQNRAPSQPDAPVSTQATVSSSAIEPIIA